MDTKKKINHSIPVWLDSKLQFAANMISNGNKTEALNKILDMALYHWDHETIKKWADENYDIQK